MTAGAHWQVWDTRQIAVLRERRGWTQEQLAERSGLSVRTIRNLELGWVKNPRRSSLDLLVHALGVAGELEQPDVTAVDHPQWRGPRPPDTGVVGHHEDREQLSQTVRANRLTTFLGPGGVGKTLLALTVAEQVAGFFRHGVVVVELGDLTPEHCGRTDQTAAILQRVRRHVDCRQGLDDSDEPVNLLLILDNAEHVPAGVTAVTRQLLATHPGVHVLITARRRITERLGVNREIRPMPVDFAGRSPAVELVLRHVGADCWPVADVATELPLVAELCRRLGGLPRYLEFAAERMRTIPIRLLLAYGPTTQMLWSNDHALLRHQRSVAGGLRWDMDLLTDEHRGLLAQIAALPGSLFTVDDVPGRLLSLLPDLLDTSLVLADPDDRYRYRLAPYVAEVMDLAGPQEVRWDTAARRPDAQWAPGAAAG